LSNLTLPPPDPNTPEGLAFLFTAGMVDPRAGKTLADRQPMMILQSMVPTAKLFWELGVRWHPELAEKWLKGGGQFQVAEVVNEQPEEFTLEQGAEEVLEILARDKPELVDTIKRIRENGTPEQKAAAVKKFEADIRQIVKMAEYVRGQSE
jgi:hypothetical protein